MPLGEIAGEALGGILRALGRILFEIFFLGIIQGTGYLLIRTVSPKSEPGEFSTAVVGVSFWSAVGVAGFWVYQTLAQG